MFQHASICCFTRSSSFVVSCEPSGAIGCELALATWVGAFGFGGVSVGWVSLRFARFLRSASKAWSSCCFGGSGLGAGAGTGAGGGGGGGGSAFGGSGFGGSGFGGSGCACAT